MDDMRISLITTVLNEEKSVNYFLDSISRLKIKPKEIVIVDGGSKDKTFEYLKKYRLPNVNIKVIKKHGNRSIGRNGAIKLSTGDIIAATDVGCVLDVNWLSRITKPFEEKSVDVVSGFYKPTYTSIFEKCLATYTCVMPDKLNETFLPSSRSIAFRKTSWQEVGGYPENLDTCEDLVFARMLKDKGCRFKFVKSAVVYWPQRKDIFQAFAQFYNYAQGDGKALYIRPQIPVLFARYLLGLILVLFYFLTKSNFLLVTIIFLLFIYLAWAVNKNYKYVMHPLALIYLPVLQLTSDVAVILGMSIGFSKRIVRT